MTFINKLKCFIGLHSWKLDWSNAIKESQNPVPGKAYFADRFCTICRIKENYECNLGGFFKKCKKER